MLNSILVPQMNEVPHSQKSKSNVMGMGFAEWRFIRNHDIHVSGGKGILLNVEGARCTIASQTTRPARTLERFESGVLLCLLWLSFTLREPELGGCEARIGFGQ